MLGMCTKITAPFSLEGSNQTVRQKARTWSLPEGLLILVEGEGVC